MDAEGFGSAQSGALVGVHAGLGGLMVWRINSAIINSLNRRKTKLFRVEFIAEHILQPTSLCFLRLGQAIR